MDNIQDAVENRGSTLTSVESNNLYLEWYKVQVTSYSKLGKDLEGTALQTAVQAGVVTSWIALLSLDL